MKYSAILSIILISAMLVLAGCAGNPGNINLPPLPGAKVTPSQTPTKVASGVSGMKTFSSWDEVSDFLRAANPNSGYYGGFGGIRGGMMALDMVAKSEGAVAPNSPQPSGGTSTDYSQTNVQVAGVDEADKVKNDGKYIYTMASSYYNYGIGPFSYGGNKGKITILDAYPASQMKIVSDIEFEGQPEGMFVYKDKLVVFGSKYEQRVYPMDRMPMCVRCIVPPYYSQNFAFMKIYDITNRASPNLEREIEAKGSYVTSRMIDGKIYAVFSDPANYPDPVPYYAVDGVARKMAPTEISYFDSPDENYNFNMFLSVDLNDLSKEETRKVMLMGYAQNLFVSTENIYVTYTKYDYYYPEWAAFSEVYGRYLPSEANEKIAAIDASNLSDWRKDKMKMAEVSDYAQKIAANVGDAQRDALQKEYYDKLSAIQQKRASEAEKTSISKVSLADFSLAAKGEVSGHVLNQFSMDESGDYFRIATTTSQVWGYNGQVAPSSSNLFVLGKDLKVAGKVTGIAPGEQIYSVRFMGSRAYMVTFKQIDPFFVLDLSVPSEPKLMGKLKIPGFSNYLHPYDENYIIGLGKEAEESKEGNFAWQKGVKLSLFDVRDIENPKEVAKFEIGDRGTDSYALTDHKAFLFSKAKDGLLVIPVLEAKIDPSRYAGGEVPQWQYGEYVFQGAYVFSVSPDSGFSLRGRVTHASADDLLKSGSYYWSNNNVQRSLYMDDYLYTVSDAYVKANNLGTLAPISSVQVGKETQQGYGYYE